jgi:hypothetical protein
MNFLMAGMVPIAALGRMLLGHSLGPLAPEFWFVMSMALLTGFFVAYPINWWLVAKGLKHGMMTVRPCPSAADDMTMAGPHAHDVRRGYPPSASETAGMAMISVVVFGLAVWLALALAGN